MYTILPILDYANVGYLDLAEEQLNKLEQRSATYS